MTLVTQWPLWLIKPKIKDYMAGILGSSTSAHQSCDWTVAPSGQHSLLQRGFVGGSWSVITTSHQRFHNCVYWKLWLFCHICFSYFKLGLFIFSVSRLVYMNRKWDEAVFWPCIPSNMSVPHGLGWQQWAWWRMDLIREGMFGLFKISIKMSRSLMSP